jgi:hypothetical protein
MLELISFGALFGIAVFLLEFHRFFAARIVFTLACLALAVRLLIAVIKFAGLWKWVGGIAVLVVSLAALTYLLSVVSDAQRDEFISRHGTFSALIPFAVEDNQAEIPIEANMENDPLHETYSNLQVGFISLERQPPNLQRPTLTDADMKGFLAHSLQYYAVPSANYEQGKGVTVTTTNPVTVPDEVTYTQDRLDKLLWSLAIPFYVTKGPDRDIAWKMYKLKVPMRTEISFIQEQSAEPTFIVRLERKSDFRLDFKIQPSGRSSGIGTYPRNFKPQLPWLIREAYSYVFIISMDFKWTGGGRAKGEPYADWAQGLFSGLQKRFVLPN